MQDKDNSDLHSSNFVKVLKEFAGADNDNEIDDDSDRKSGAININDGLKQEKQRVGLLVPDPEAVGAPEDLNAKSKTAIAEEREEGTTGLRVYVEFFRSGSSVLVLLSMGTSNFILIEAGCFFGGLLLSTNRFTFSSSCNDDLSTGEQQTRSFAKLSSLDQTNVKCIVRLASSRRAGFFLIGRVSLLKRRGIPRTHIYILRLCCRHA